MGIIGEQITLVSIFMLGKLGSLTDIDLMVCSTTVCSRAGTLGLLFYNVKNIVHTVFVFLIHIHILIHADGEYN